MGRGMLRGRRAPVPAWAAVALGLVPAAVLLAAWWLLTRGEPEYRAISPVILPTPADVFGFVPRLLHTPGDAESAFWRQVLLSFRRVALGFGVAVAVALPLGTLVASFRGWRLTFGPTVAASGYVPIAALVPLSMSWWGTGEMQKVLFLALAFLVYLLPLVIRALDAVPDVYVSTAHTLGASRAQVILRVLLPVAAPDIWHALRLAFGVGWSYLVLVEMTVLAGGLGAMIFTGQRRSELRPQIYVVLAVITLIAWAVDLGWARLGRVLFPYREERA